jgi:hypothetical protein
MSEKIISNSLALPKSSLKTLALFLANILLIGMVTAMVPPEQTLGTNIRLIYLHGAWVWTAKVVFGAAALAGLAGLIFLHRRVSWQGWSLALGRAGLLYWLIYLPLALLVMWVNWGGFYFDEPRWRVSLMLGIVALLLQVALYLLDSPRIASIANLLFGVALWGLLDTTPVEMHPVSPIFSSDSAIIQVFFLALTVLVLLLAAQVTVWMRTVFVKREP